MKYSVGGHLRSLLQAMRGGRSVALKKEPLHFLHIRKTSGTAIKYALTHTPCTERYEFKLHDHNTRLRDIPVGEKVVFFARDPVTRFVSGFNSRKRQGQPRVFIPWSTGEAAAFALFKTPNELGMALSAEDAGRRQAARDAMGGIHHVKSSYWDWFENEAYLRSRFDDLYFIGFQESSDADFETLRRRLNLPATVQLPTDDERAHRTPAGMDTRLEPTAANNLQVWYERDYDFLKLCLSMANEINGFAK